MTRWAAILTALILAGCAGQAKLRVDPELTALSTPLIGGLSQIRDKAIDAPDIDHLFIGGLNHLSAIDPDLRALAVGDEVILSLADKAIAHAPLPRSQDIGAWTETTQALIGQARGESKLIQLANSEALLQAMFDGIMPMLDTYSRYYSRSDARRNQANRNGFVGLGVDIDAGPKGAYVRRVTKDGPAEIAGDIIVRAQGQRLAGQSLTVALRRLDGPRDSTVSLELLRDGVALAVTARRSLIIPQTVEADLSDGVLHLAVKSFNQRTAASIAEKVTEAGALRGIILDLRGDPGGLLDQAVAVADLFLNEGVIATLRGRHPGARQFYAAAAGDIAAGVPIVMLLDGRTASAAEILAAALQDDGRAIAVGTASVGKGTVQTIVPLSNGGEFALTWSRVFTPAGTMLSGRGILPDVCTGGGSTVSAEDMIAALVRQGPQPRQSAEIVRATCRPEPRGKETPDLAVARALATDTAVRTALLSPGAGQLATTP